MSSLNTFHGRRAKYLCIMYTAVCGLASSVLLKGALSRFGFTFDSLRNYISQRIKKFRVAMTSNGPKPYTVTVR